jgi:hypothetical protein
MGFKVQEAEAELGWVGLAVTQLQAARENKLPKALDHNKSRQQSLLRDVEARLNGVVRSPYDFTVKKIKWIGQANQE